MLKLFSPFASAGSAWTRLWHAPVRAERLAFLRILFGLSILTDELFQYMPHLGEFFGPEGVAPAGHYAYFQHVYWQLSVMIFPTDDLRIIKPVFGLWVAVTVTFLVGWQTRKITVLLWLLTRFFVERNPQILESGDDVMRCTLFLLMLTPSGDALSIDAWLKRRRGLLKGPAWVSPWSLRLVQLQLCLIYCTTGLVKLKGERWDLPWGNSFWPQFLQGMWWDGTSVHYFLNLTFMSRRAFAEYPVPFWITMPSTYLSVWWETTFPLLMLNRVTRRLGLVFGLLFHVGIFVTVEIGWFGFYMASLYAVWTPDSFWARFDKTAHSTSV